MNNKKNVNRVIILLIATMFLTVFVLVNDQQRNLAAIIYIIIAILSIFLYRQWDNFGRKSGNIGIDDNFRKDFLVGAGLGIGTIILGQFVSIIGVIGLPNVQSLSGVLGRFIIIVIAAPVFEEILFRDLMLNFFDEKVKDIPFVVANLIIAILFALYHISAYGGSLSAASGSFISAGLMGFAFGVVRYYQKSVMGAIAYHMVLNLYLGFVILAVII